MLSKPLYVGRDVIPVTRPGSQSREPGFKSHGALGKFDQPTLPQFTQLYKWVPGNTDSGGNVNE